LINSDTRSLRRKYRPTRPIACHCRTCTDSHVLRQSSLLLVGVKATLGRARWARVTLEHGLQTARWCPGSPSRSVEMSVARVKRVNLWSRCGGAPHGGLLLAG
jgi:hypothetical protein